MVVQLGRSQLWVPKEQVQCRWRVGFDERYLAFRQGFVWVARSAEGSLGAGVFIDIE